MKRETFIRSFMCQLAGLPWVQKSMESFPRHLAMLRRLDKEGICSMETSELKQDEWLNEPQWMASSIGLTFLYPTEDRLKVTLGLLLEWTDARRNNERTTELLMLCTHMADQAIGKARY